MLISQTIGSNVPENSVINNAEFIGSPQLVMKENANIVILYFMARTLLYVLRLVTWSASERWHNFFLK